MLLLSLFLLVLLELQFETVPLCPETDDQPILIIIFARCILLRYLLHLFLQLLLFSFELADLMVVLFLHISYQPILQVNLVVCHVSQQFLLLSYRNIHICYLGLRHLSLVLKLFLFVHIVIILLFQSDVVQCWLHLGHVH